MIGLQVALIGHQGCGKSSLWSSFTASSTDDHKNTSQKNHIRRGRRTLTKHGSPVALTILDVNGQPNRIPPVVLEASDAIVVVFDAVRGGGFDTARRWLQCAAATR